MEHNVKIHSCTQLHSKHIQSIFNYFTINEVCELTNKFMNRTLYTIYQIIYLK